MVMIPSTITAEHVRQAAAEIHASGIPKGRDADKFLVLVDGETFPPKFILSIAGKYATGTELSAADFSGGEEANGFLEKLNFMIIPKNQDWSEEECLFAVWAYDEMDRDHTLVKKKLYEEVSGLIGRTAKAVEWKLQNVSYCDPRSRSEKPINEAANKQQLLQEVFDNYWKDRDAARRKAIALRSSRVPKESPWDLAINRVRTHKSHHTYMPVALIAALELIQEGEVTPQAIPFDKLETRFDALQASIGEGATGMAWEPFVHLASGAKIWHLMSASGPVVFDWRFRPKSRSQLVKLVDRVALNGELQTGIEEATLIPRLKALIGTTNHKPTADPDVLAAAVEALKGKLGSEPPSGNPNPKKSQGSKGSYERDPKVVRWVLDRARGTCELCGQRAPFLDSKGEPFLEVHHIIHLSESGPDTVENARGLCPNCHREIHHGTNAPHLKERLLLGRAPISWTTKRE